MMLLIVLVAYQLDLTVGSSYIRDTVIIAFIVNETISILENAKLMGIPIPEVIDRALDILKIKTTMKARRNNNMPKAIDLSTAGIHVGYGFETTAGTKPTAFIDIPNPKSIPDLNPEPSTYDTTSLNATEWKTYIQGLKDLGGALGLKFGMSQVFKDMWTKICSEYKTNIATGKRLWIEFYHPSLKEGFFSQENRQILVGQQQMLTRYGTQQLMLHQQVKLVGLQL